MNIEKGYTLSQFVDIAAAHKDDEWTCKELIDLAEKIGCYVGSEIASAIANYNNFLKQPLKKEMFVNEFEKPNESLRINGGFTDFELYNKQNDRFKEAEKKVIFKWFKQWKQGYFELENGLVILFTGNGVYLGLNGSDSNYIDIEIKTLGQLFDETNGELETQNITI